MGDAEDENTPADELEASGFGVGEPAKEKREGISEETEGISHGIGGDGAETKGTGGLLVALGRGAIAVAAVGEGAVDVVGEQGLHAIVRSSLAKFHNADEVRDEGD
jgi:hypothetical protein